VLTNEPSANVECYDILTAYKLKIARFPSFGDLNGVDIASSEITEALVQ